jgi:hypothetical protein
MMFNFCELAVSTPDFDIQGMQWNEGVLSHRCIESVKMQMAIPFLCVDLSKCILNFNTKL